MEKIIEAADYLKSKLKIFEPEVGVILGSGLGSLPDEYECVKIPYAQIPHFQKPSIEGHKGQLCFCEVEGKKVVMMQGRYHYYEGYSMGQITFPVKVMKFLGVKTIIITNAAGSVKKGLNVGDLMLITDHINMMGANPLIGKNYEDLGVRFPDMSDVYKSFLREKVLEIAKKVDIELKQGVYLAMTGPSYETPAEVRMANLIGADAIGMSTAPEAIMANYLGINVIGLSCITNYAAGVSDKKLSHQEVIETADRINTRFKTLIKSIIKGM